MTKEKNFKTILIVILIVIILFLLFRKCPQQETEQQRCVDNGGVWKQFPNSCADLCKTGGSPDYICSNVLTMGCDCLRGCWDKLNCR